MNIPNWVEIETRIYEKSLAAIDKFAIEHADEEVCYFSYDSDPPCEYVNIGIDVTSHSQERARDASGYSIDLVKRSIKHLSKSNAVF